MFSKLSQRERLLLLTAGLAVAVIGFVVLRYKPQRAQLSAIVRETEEGREELQKVSVAREPSEEPAELARQLSQAQETLQREKGAVDQLRRMFASADEAEMLQELVVEISALAQAAHVTIRESVPYVPPTGWKLNVVAPTPGNKPDGKANPTTGPFLDRELLAELCGQRLQELTLDSSFGGLQSFLDGLNRLKWKVTVVHFDVQTGKAPNSASRPPLTTKLVLAL